MTRIIRIEGVRRGLFAGLLAAAAATATGAELRGEVVLEGGARFGGLPEAGTVTVSVAAFPLEGQPLPRVAPRTVAALVRHRRFEPLYRVLRRGDTLVVRNADRLYHEIFSLSTVRPFRRRLAPRGGAGASARFRFDEPGTWHVFCRIHASMYLRLDVLDTPYVAVLQGGGRFRLTGLAPGRWRLRVAAVGADTLEVEADAITRPPPLRLVLRVRGGG